MRHQLISVQAYPEPQRWRFKTGQTLWATALGLWLECQMAEAGGTWQNKSLISLSGKKRSQDPLQEHIPLTQEHPPSLPLGGGPTISQECYLGIKPSVSGLSGTFVQTLDLHSLSITYCYAMETTLSYLGFWLGCLRPWFRSHLPFYLLPSPTV